MGYIDSVFDIHAAAAGYKIWSPEKGVRLGRHSSSGIDGMYPAEPESISTDDLPGVWNYILCPHVR